MKISFKYLNTNPPKKEQNKINLNSSFKSSSYSNQTPLTKTRKTELRDLIYETDESNMEVLEIKKYLADKLQVEKEYITIVKITSSRPSYFELPDYFDILEFSSELENKEFHYTYSKEGRLIRINIEHYLENMQIIKLNVPYCCSIYMIKSNLAEMLSTSVNNIELLNLKTNKPYENRQNVLDIYTEYLNYESENINSIGSVNSSDDSFHSLQINADDSDMSIKLIKTNKKKCSIEIDFSFNYLKEIKKIEYQESAPDHREASDGINFICYCENKKCKIFKEMFIVKYGKYKD